MFDSFGHHSPVAGENPPAARSKGDGPMRALLTFAVLFLAQSASAQTSGTERPTSPFQNMQASDAARLNHAAQTDTRVRGALDQAERTLKEANHPSGTLLEKTRP
jgi:hypothetical protein